MHIFLKLLGLLVCFGTVGELQAVRCSNKVVCADDERCHCWYGGDGMYFKCVCKKKDVYEQDNYCACHCK